VNRVHPTQKGNSVLKKMEQIGNEMNAKVMKGIPPARQHELAELLHLMKVNLIEMDVVPGSRERRDRANSASEQMAHEFG
jgi:hypothetical protein